MEFVVHISIVTKYTCTIYDHKLVAHRPDIRGNSVYIHTIDTYIPCTGLVLSLSVV